jgi:predicted dehydrogenase
MKYSLVVGLGNFGRVYKTILEQMKHRVYTVDPYNASADFSSIAETINIEFETAHICTPNYSHYALARQAAVNSRIVFVEKPGFESAEHWSSIQDEFPGTRFTMTKNNQYRSNIKELKQLARECKNIHLHWINYDRVPGPGSWFTNQDLAFGGVSKDLAPHMFSLVAVLEPNYKNIAWSNPITFRNWRLNDLTTTAYGQINEKGVYDVDDRFEISGTLNRQRQYHVRTDWRSMTHTDVGIHFGEHFVELGLCPEDAYVKMIDTAMQNFDNQAFWNEQRAQDQWIQKLITI